jgi:Domain of unknown function (DUF4129)
MSSPARLSLLLSFFLCLAAVAKAEDEPPAQVPPPPLAVAQLSMPEYMAELDRLSLATERLNSSEDASKLIETIPQAWRVVGTGGTFEISSGWVRSDLAEWQKGLTRGIQDRIISRLGELRSEAASFQASQPDSSLQRALLNQILASPEFKAVRGPGWWDRWKQQVQNWLLNLLLHLFSSSAIPTISNVVVYGLIGLALLALAYWIYRTIRDNARLEVLFPDTLPVSSKEWTAWMAEAHAAADAANWRDAVHLAYWCGVSFLEAQGWWPPDRARTPREYLRLLPSSSEHGPTLRALTGTFEVVWYGTQPADAQAFSNTIAQLEKLGCQYR